MLVLPQGVQHGPIDILTACHNKFIHKPRKTCWARVGCIPPVEYLRETEQGRIFRNYTTIWCGLAVLLIREVPHCVGNMSMPNRATKFP